MTGLETVLDLVEFDSVQADSASVSLRIAKQTGKVDNEPGQDDQGSPGADSAEARLSSTPLMHQTLAEPHTKHLAEEHRSQRARCCSRARKYSTILLLVSILVFLGYHHHYSTGAAAKPTAGVPLACNSSPVRATDAPLPLLNQKVEWVTVAIDMGKIADCIKGHNRSQPCRNKTAYITSESHVLRPLRCVDDAFLEDRRANADSCAVPSSTFELRADEGRILVHRGGTYLIIAHITVRMREAAQVHFGVAINGDHLAFLCTVQSYGAAGPDEPAPYSHCSVQGLRQLKPGDEVSLFVSNAEVPLQPLYRSTFAQLARLGD